MGRADEGRHSAEDAGETERHHGFLRGGEILSRESGEDWDEGDGHRRIVEEGADGEDEDQSDDESEEGVDSSDFGEDSGRSLQRFGLEESLSDDEEREDRDEGGVREAREEEGGAGVMAFAFA